jgi:adenylylsulfate kinase
MVKPSPLIPSAVVFFTGLSGAGKTTIAKVLVNQLQKRGAKPVLLDGDEIRLAFQLSGFDEASRKKHNLNVGALAALLESQGHIVIVSLIAPYDDIRKHIRGSCRRFIEVYVSTALSLCMERDPKGLYQKAIRGEIKDFTGISAPYQPPTNAELVLDTAILSPDQCAGKILSLLEI